MCRVYKTARNFFVFCPRGKFSDTSAESRMPRCTFALLFVAFLVYFENLKNAHCEIRPSILDLMSIALHRDIKFMYERPEQMNVDAIFGLNFVQVHAGAALKHENSILLGERNRRMLQEILTLCAIAKNDGKDILKASGLEMMIRPEIWNQTIFWRRDELDERPPRSLELTAAKAISLINQGTPSESESLRCFVDLLVQYENLICNIPKECGDMLKRDDSPRGYPLTHRLLYVQLATALGCEEQSENEFAGMKKAFCTAILQDLTDFKSLNFPAFSRDLAMEQIVLCGMEGFLEFVDERYAKLITGWPNSHGCYSAFGFDREEENREKRSTSLMDYGCDNHASGVAAASLSLLIRSAIENSISEFL